MASQPIAAINTFLIQSPTRDRSRILLLLAPPPKHHQLLGRLFLLVDYPPRTPLPQFLTRLSTHLLRHYEEEAATGPENAFERHLEYVNRLIKQSHETDGWIGKQLPGHKPPAINFLIGCLKNNQLQFAVAGQINGYIIFKDGNKYRHLDLLKTYGGEVKEAGREELFLANLISGDLQPDNWVIFCTAPVFDFLTPDRLVKILSSQPTEEACRYLEKTLSQIETALSFGGIIINTSRSTPKTPSLPLRRLTSDSSIRLLARQERETEKIMAPSTLSLAKDIWSKLMKKTTSLKAGPSDAETVKRIIKIYNRLTGWQGQLKNWRRGLIQTFIKTAAGVRKYLSGLTLSRRLLLAGLLIIISIVCASAGGLVWKKNSRLEQERYNQLVNRLKEKLDSAESAIIYKNETEAGRLIAEVKNELTNFSQTSSNRRAMLKQLATQLKNINYKLGRWQTVSPETVLDLTALSMPCAPTDLFATKKILYFFCFKNTALWQYDLNKKETTALTSPLVGNLSAAHFTKDGRLLLLNGDNRLASFDQAAKSFASAEITWPKALTEIKLISAYNVYLYALDVKNNLIYKHGPSTTGYGQGAPWLKETKKLDDVSSWAIDGAIYLAKNNGEIWKLENGRQQNFSLKGVEPAVSSPARIWTNSEAQFLFILEPTQKRIIAWNKKDNQLTAQYIAEELTEAKDLSVDEKNKIIYLLGDKKIRQIKY